MTWPNGSAFTAEAHRCLACGAIDLLRRDIEKALADYQPTPRQAAPGDGLHLLTRPKPQEV